MKLIAGDAKLSDLNAQFIGGLDPIADSYHTVAGLDGAQGVMFQCPKCAQGKEIIEQEDDFEGESVMMKGVSGAHYIICWFKNPMKARPVPESISPGPGRWTAWGTCIDDLTLTPSVFLKTGCAWHGFIRDGVATLN